MNNSSFEIQNTSIDLKYKIHHFEQYKTRTFSTAIARSMMSGPPAVLLRATQLAFAPPAVEVTPRAKLMLAGSTVLTVNAKPPPVAVCSQTPVAACPAAAVPSSHSPEPTQLPSHAVRLQPIHHLKYKMHHLMQNSSFQIQNIPTATSLAPRAERCVRGTHRQLCSLQRVVRLPPLHSRSVK